MVTPVIVPPVRSPFAVAKPVPVKVKIELR